MKILDIFENIFSFLKSLFLNGLFTILPITATIFFMHFTYNLLVGWLYPLKKMEPLFLQKIPGAEIIIVTLLILLIGALVKLLIITPIIHRIEKIIAKIPLIRTIYSSAKIVVNFFNIPDPTHTRKKVVLIQFPKKGYYNIAFLLESAQDNFKKLIPDDEKKYVKIFMPNSPTPATGYFFILPEDEIIPTDITFEEAIQTIVSCGLITPETIKKMK
ncbi:DUF502 domain-containing protein [Candidatus Babeliales bacterium]|nr:DUF502 domain-containing protein [Candidatus Babeliales bacterium]